jgi:hypothetical protein
MRIQTCSIKIHFTRVLPSILFLQYDLFMQVSSSNPGHISQLPIRATFPAHHIHLDLFNRIISGEQYESSSLSLCTFPSVPFIPHKGTTRCRMCCTLRILNYFCNLLMTFFVVFSRKSPYGIFSTLGSTRKLFAYQKFLCVFIAGLEILQM